jgi:hypothetical protein
MNNKAKIMTTQMFQRSSRFIPRGQSKQGNAARVYITGVTGKLVQLTLQSSTQHTANKARDDPSSRTIPHSKILNSRTKKRHAEYSLDYE